MVEQKNERIDHRMAKRTERQNLYTPEILCMTYV